MKLAVGEEKTLMFELTGEDLQLVDPTGATVLIHGDWSLSCEEATATFAICSVCSCEIVSCRCTCCDVECVVYSMSNCTACPTRHLKQYQHQ